jgi:hypothetical protein
MTEHPITPPPELVEQWVQATESNDCIGAFPTNFEKRICTAAARWGADQELDACCEWLDEGFGDVGNFPAILRVARRPHPPSLKEQALTALSEADQGLNESEWQQRSDTIRRALEQLDD